ncbi:MAG: hypothetical protein ACQCN4_06170 [Candidatus Bathyarchaeia archaeon]|jgi:hypothetical protein
MGFYGSFKDVFDAAKAAMQTKQAIKAVLLGEQFTYEALPKAVINALPSTISQAALGDVLEVKVNFSVILVINENEPKDWFQDIIAVMADVVDAVITDRTLGGKAADCVPTSFAPGEIKFENKLFYGGEIRFQALVYYPSN